MVEWFVEHMGVPYVTSINVAEGRFRFDHNFEPPSALDQLAGPADGVVELPVDLAWSGDRRFDLADPVQRYLYHMTVLTSAVTREHYARWLTASLLCGDWSRLRLPRPLRETRQAHFPELGPE